MSNLFELSLAFAIFSMLGYGVVDLIAFLMSNQADPRKVPLWTTALSIIFLGIGIFFFRFPSFSMNDLILVAIGAVTGVIALLSFYKGLNAGKLSVVVPIANAWPVVVVLIGILLLSEPVTALQISGVALALTGTLLVSFRYKDFARLGPSKIAKGAEYAAITLVGWGIFYAIIGILSKALGWYWPTIIEQAAVGILLLAYLLFTRTDLSFPSKIKYKLLVFGVLLSASFLLYSVSANFGYIAISAPIVGASPLITVLLGVFLLKEKVEKSQVAGILLIVIGIALISL